MHANDVTLLSQNLTAVAADLFGTNSTRAAEIVLAHAQDPRKIAPQVAAVAPAYVEGIDTLHRHLTAREAHRSAIDESRVTGAVYNPQPISEDLSLGSAPAQETDAPDGDPRLDTALDYAFRLMAPLRPYLIQIEGVDFVPATERVTDTQVAWAQAVLGPLMAMAGIVRAEITPTIPNFRTGEHESVDMAKEGDRRAWLESQLYAMRGLLAHRD